MVNARIRKTVRATQAKVGYIGASADFNYDHDHLGTGPQTLVEIVEGRHPFCSVLQSEKTLSSLLELAYLNGRTKMPYSQRSRL
jgi:hypothetical protein